MSKNKKILIVVIGIIVLVAVVIGVVILVDHLTEKPDGGVHKEVFEGKIIEIIDDNTIIAEATAERTSKVKLGEKVTIKYHSVYACIYNENVENEDITDKYEMQVGDVINIGFWEKDLKTESGTRIIDTQDDFGEITLYFEDYENRTFI